MSSRVAGSMKAPPPVASTCGGWVSSRAMTRRSPSRNTASPRWRKISSMVSPAAASISLSESKNGRPRRAASRRPILVFPAPISPTSTIVRLGTKSGAFALDPPARLVWTFTALRCIPRRSSVGRPGRVLAYRVASSSIGADLAGIGCGSRHGKSEAFPDTDRDSGGRWRLHGSGLLGLSRADDAGRKGPARCPFPEIGGPQRRCHRAGSKRFSKC